MRFNQKQKREHYMGVAKGRIPVKISTKYSSADQVVYAKGQADARNESARICAYKNATPKQREEYKAKQKARREQYKKNKK